MIDVGRSRTAKIRFYSEYEFQLGVEFFRSELDSESVSQFPMEFAYLIQEELHTAESRAMLIICVRDLCCARRAQFT